MTQLAEADRVDAVIDEIAQRILLELENAKSMDLTDVSYAKKILHLADIHYAKRVLQQITESTAVELKVRLRKER